MEHHGAQCRFGCEWVVARFHSINLAHALCMIMIETCKSQRFVKYVLNTLDLWRSLRKHASCKHVGFTLLVVAPHTELCQSNLAFLQAVHGPPGRGWDSKVGKNYDSERQGMGKFSRPHYIFLSTSDWTYSWVQCTYMINVFFHCTRSRWLWPAKGQC